MECPLVVQCWADLQSVHGFCCYDNIVPNAKCQRVLVLAVDIVCEGYNVKDDFTCIVIISSHNRVDCAIAE